MTDVVGIPGPPPVRMGRGWRRRWGLWYSLRLTFPRAKLRRQIFMTWADVWAKNWAKNWAKISAHFRASFAVQNDPQIFSQNSSQFITPCLEAEILKFHLRELLGFWGRKYSRCPGGWVVVCLWPMGGGGIGVPVGQRGGRCIPVGHGCRGAALLRECLV